MAGPAPPQHLLPGTGSLLKPPGPPPARAQPLPARRSRGGTLSHELGADLRRGRGLQGGLGGGPGGLRPARRPPGDPGQAGDGALGDALHALAGHRGCLQGRPRARGGLWDGHRRLQGAGIRHRGALDHRVQRGRFPAPGAVGKGTAAQGGAPEGAVGGRGANAAGRALQWDPVRHLPAVRGHLAHASVQLHPGPRLPPAAARRGPHLLQPHLVGGAAQDQVQRHREDVRGDPGGAAAAGGLQEGEHQHEGDGAAAARRVPLLLPPQDDHPHRPQTLRGAGAGQEEESSDLL